VDDLIRRLEDARVAIAARRAGVERGEPWPLSAAYGTEPESDWGPKEVLAHSAEMIPFWSGEIERILAAPVEADPVPFGRVATDPNRIDRIGRDRALPAAELFDRIEAGAIATGARLTALSADELSRRGLHPRAGEMTIPAIVERFIVVHLEEHVEQLDGIVARRNSGGSPAA
jgi:hypothetical protein